MAEKIILLVQDNTNDVALVKKAFLEFEERFRLVVVSNGQEALGYLSGQGRYADRKTYPEPALVLLDLNLPIVDGFKVLDWRNKDELLRRVPVVVLAGSNRQPDMQQAYAMGADSFVVKPLAMADLVKELKAALDYWVLGLQPQPSSSNGPSLMPGA